VIVLPEDKMNEIRDFQGDYSLVTQSERDKKAYRLEKYEEAREAYNQEREKMEEEGKNQLTGIYSAPDFVCVRKIFQRNGIF
jgi:hypothetical protein